MALFTQPKKRPKKKKKKIIEHEYVLSYFRKPKIGNKNSMSTQEKVLGIAKNGGNKKIYVTHLTVRQSISLLIIKLILIDIITAIIFLVSHSILFNTDISSSINISPTSYNTIVFLILVIGKILLTCYLVLQWLNEYYEITPDAITHKKGLLFRKVKRHDLALIRSVKVEHGLIARLLNYGNISLYDVRLNKDIELYLIHNPIKYLHILEEIIPNLEEEKQFFREKVLEDGKE